MAHTIKRAAHEAKRGLTEWQRRVALDIAQALPMGPLVPIRATGNHLASQNDEPEPTAFTEAELLAADLEHNRRKPQKAHERNDAQALSAQVMDMDAMRRAGWL